MRNIAPIQDSIISQLVWWFFQARCDDGPYPLQFFVDTLDSRQADGFSMIPVSLLTKFMRATINMKNLVGHIDFDLEMTR